MEIANILERGKALVVGRRLARRAAERQPMQLASGGQGLPPPRVIDPSGAATAASAAAGGQAKLRSSPHSRAAGFISSSNAGPVQLSTS